MSVANYGKVITTTLLVLLAQSRSQVSAFTGTTHTSLTRQLPQYISSTPTALSSTENDDASKDETTTASTTIDTGARERSELKRALLSLGASYDRGFGATPSARTKADTVITSLTTLNPTPDASRGVDDGIDAPLRGAWRMVWCTAQDVLSLAASPLSTVGAIYQVIDPPVATNIIDLIPRAQALLPPGIAPSLLRAEVKTRVSKRGSLPLRVGLDFEGVALKPVTAFGLDVGSLPPLGWNFPSFSGLLQNIPGYDEETSPGFFDVLYLDDELLVIKQNEPGGVFALTKAENYDP